MTLVLFLETRTSIWSLGGQGCFLCGCGIVMIPLLLEFFDIPYFCKAQKQICLPNGVWWICDKIAFMLFLLDVDHLSDVRGGGRRGKEEEEERPCERDVRWLNNMSSMERRLSFKGGGRNGFEWVGDTVFPSPLPPCVTWVNLLSIYVWQVTFFCFRAQVVTLELLCGLFQPRETISWVTEDGAYAIWYPPL